MVLPPTVDGTICRDEAGLTVHVTYKSNREPELRVLFMRTSDKIIYRAKKRSATFASYVVLSLILLIRDEKLRSKCVSFKIVLITSFQSSVASMFFNDLLFALISRVLLLVILLLHM